MTDSDGERDIPHLICDLHGSRYAVDARAVREVFRLPELTPIEELPEYIAGVVNVRGAVIPVMDLDLRFGRTKRPYSLTDVVVVLTRDDAPLGLIFSDVDDVQAIGSDAVVSAPTVTQPDHRSARLISRLAKLGADILMVLDHARLYPADDTQWGPEAIADADACDQVAPAGAPRPGLTPRAFWPDASASERTVLRERSHDLLRAVDDADVSGRIPMAAVQLGGEYFGVDLDVIQEFSRVQNVAPVPCCPPHIVGQSNLRGDILTLVDVRRLLNLPTGRADHGAEVMVVEVDGVRIGILVDGVADVVYVHQHEITEVPTAVKSTGPEYLRGAAPFGATMLGILDVRGLLKNGGLTVNEEV